MNSTSQLQLTQKWRQRPKEVQPRSSAQLARAVPESRLGARALLCVPSGSPSSLARLPRGVTQMRAGAQPGRAAAAGCALLRPARLHSNVASVPLQARLHPQALQTASHLDKASKPPPRGAGKDARVMGGAPGTKTDPKRII